MSELLPCPFCILNEEELKKYRPEVIKDRDGSFQVQCTYCENVLWEASEEEAINRWNNRPQITKDDAYLKGFYDCKKQLMKMIDRIFSEETPKDSAL